MNDTADIVELLKLIEEENKALEEKHNPTPTPEEKASKPKFKINKQVEWYINNTGLEPGDIKMPTYVIYYNYVKWARKRWLIPPYRKEEFFRTFKQHFKQKRNGNQRFYMVNDALNLDKEYYEKAKKYDKKIQNKRRKKAKESKREE